MNNQFKVFLRHFADEQTQRNTVPRLKTLERRGIRGLASYNNDYNGMIRGGGISTSYVPTVGICPNEVATAMKSLSRMMGVQIK